MTLPAYYTGTPGTNTNLNGIGVSEGMARGGVSDAFRQLMADLFTMDAAIPTSTSLLTPNVQAVVSAATVTPTFTNDQVNITAQAVALALANPTGTAKDAWGIAIRIKDNGAPRAITYGAQYRAFSQALPTTTTAGKTLYIGMIFNNTDTKWDVVSTALEV